MKKCTVVKAHIRRGKKVKEHVRCKQVKTDIFKKLEEENKYTLPKVPTNKVFKNDVEILAREQTNKSSKYFDDDSYKSLPIERININKIIPTQKNLNIDNLKAVKNISIDTEAFLHYYNDQYYILDGHHRIAINILNGNNTIKAYVFRE